MSFSPLSQQHMVSSRLRLDTTAGFQLRDDISRFDLKVARLAGPRHENLSSRGYGMDGDISSLKGFSAMD